MLVIVNSDIFLHCNSIIRYLIDYMSFSHVKLTSEHNRRQVKNKLKLLVEVSIGKFII